MIETLSFQSLRENDPQLFRQNEFDLDGALYTFTNNNNKNFDLDSFLITDCDPDPTSSRRENKFSHLVLSVLKTMVGKD